MAKPLKKTKLNYRIYNPNSTEATAEYIAKILVDVNRKKIENLLITVAAPPTGEEKSAAE